MPYYLFPAVAAAAGAVTPAARPLPELGLAIESYVRLLEEMDAAARHQGATLEVVLIPEASMADAEFRAFWRGMPLPSEPLSIAHALHRSLASALANTGIRTLDLADEPGLLDGAYWFLDGHFNDTGNARVASRVARWLHP